MVIHPKFLSSVVEIGDPLSGGDANWHGTGFFFGQLMSIPGHGNREYAIYLVTARHVFEPMDSNSGRPRRLDMIAVRLNADRHSVPLYVDLPVTDAKGKTVWIGHPDPTVDIAVIPVANTALEALQRSGTLFRSDSESFTLQEAQNCWIGEGSPVCVLGFPSRLSTLEKTFVLARSGIIARIEDTYAGLARAFLIDAPILTGNSGGPVLWTPSVPLQTPPPSTLIGVVRGLVPEEGFVSEGRGELDRIRLGWIEPVDRIRETIQAHRKRESTY